MDSVSPEDKGLESEGRERAVVRDEGPEMETGPESLVVVAEEERVGTESGSAAAVEEVPPAAWRDAKSAGPA